MRKKKDLLYLSNRWKKINVKDWSAGSVKHLKAKIIFRKVPTLKAKSVIKRNFFPGGGNQCRPRISDRYHISISPVLHLCSDIITH